MIDDFIDPGYCKQLIGSALAGGGTDDTTMRQSTAPAPQLDAGALWPLAPIVLLAAVPSALHAVEDGSDVLAACVRAWGVAAGLVAGLAAAAPRVMAMATPESRTSSSALLGDRRLTDEVTMSLPTPPHRDPTTNPPPHRPTTPPPHQLCVCTPPAGPKGVPARGRGG